MNAVRSIVREFTRGDKPLNILCSPTHERYESNLAKTGHNFYGFTAVESDGRAVVGMKPWNDKFAKRPTNYHLIGNKLPINVDFDLVLSQNKFGQYQNLAPIASALQIPLISLEHTLPIPGWRPEALEQCRASRGDRDIFISEYSCGEWGMTGEVIEHGLDTTLFSPLNYPREKRCLSVVNDWINRDYCCGFNIWREVIEGFPFFVLGDTAGLSKPATSIQHLVSEYNKSLIFVNTSTISPVPTVLLEAMACGCAVVSTATCMIPEIITDGVDGFISNDVSVLRNRIELLLSSPELAIKMGQAARDKIVARFSLERFVKDWNRVFTESVVYKNDFVSN